MKQYGCITPNAKAVEYPVAASQKFYRKGGHFVYLDASGHITLALTATATLFGYVPNVPAGQGAEAAGSAYWQSSATAGADKLLVIRDLTAEYFVPASTTATAAMCGDACDIIGVNDGTVQTADVDTSTTDVLLIRRTGTSVGGAATDVVVSINPAKVQADT